MTGNKPLTTYQSGNVKLTVWENEIEYKGKKNKVKSYSPSKSYKDKEGNWKNTTSFNRDELLNLGALIQKAATENTEKGENTEE